MKIVIADDSEAMREALAATLPVLVQGIEIVGQAQDVRDAIESTLRLQPDALILDGRMPGGSGLDVLREVKRGATAPLVVVFTSHSSAAHRDAYLAAGADFFFSKSKELEGLVTTLQRYACIC
jgi:DNA-binding NarL/FixJ family response regulator